jgi:hypothetical protein
MLVECALPHNTSMTYTEECIQFSSSRGLNVGIVKEREQRMVSSGLLRRVALVRTDVSEEPRFLQEPHGVTTQKTPFFIVTAVKTSNLTKENKIMHAECKILVFHSGAYEECRLLGCNACGSC